MAMPSREAIDTFIGVTGASEAIAVQKLEAHGDDLNAAVNAYFNEGDRSSSVNAHPTSVSGDYDFMDIDDPVEVEPQGPPQSLLSAAREIMNPFSLLDQNLRQGLFDHASDFTSSAPMVTHPREVREIPIEFRDGSRPSGQSGQSGHVLTIEDVTGTVDAHGQEVRGTVVIDDNEDEEPLVASVAHAPDLEHRAISSHDSRDRNAISGAFESAEFQDRNDIEEEMIRAAIEASKKDVVQAYPSDPLTTQTDLSNLRAREHLSHLSDLELSPAASSIKPEEDFPERGENIGGSKTETSKLTDVELRKVTSLNGRMETGSTSAQDEVEDLEEVNLIRHRTKRKSSGNAEPAKGVEIVDLSLASSPKHPDSSNNPQHNGNAFQSDEWGGISSEEHDEAVMLEAAMFGGGSEGSSYRFPSAPHEFMRNQGSYVQPAPRPPSPSLVAQRLIREQQDDEYLAALEADREKELKAMAEAAAVREKERQREEESRQKLDAEKELERHLAEIEASLPSEPRSDDENAVTLLVRMPDGSRRGRRFLKSDKLQCLFDFIDIGRVVKPGSYRLVRPYPRKAFGDGESSLTLNELGVNSKQEAFYLELI
ncbi:plant UBX domain-containing protein 8-like [Cucurbita moschata]|uniref:Plant UBX domain-containing protein 8-like n=1 Tax=Cucurbita moschata TaxID=3662 RepID=A0A6J1FY83_CUCMO|nr:plant UBX domain-containing protein 8-like [Cucurbita moschata]